jgi:hypothetical protein
MAGWRRSVDLLVLDSCPRPEWSWSTLGLDFGAVVARPSSCGLDHLSFYISTSTSYIAMAGPGYQTRKHHAHLTSTLKNAALTQNGLFP